MQTEYELDERKRSYFPMDAETGNKAIAKFRKVNYDTNSDVDKVAKNTNNSSFTNLGFFNFDLKKYLF